MALTKDQKIAQVKELSDKLKDAESVMFSHYIGLSVADVSDLRNQLRENKAEMKVAKKTLMKLAFKEAGYPDIEAKEIDGAVACIFSYEDPLSGAQTAFKFSKKHDHVELVGGVYDGKLLTKEEATELAKMPGRQELLGMFASMLVSPLSSFASICANPLSGFARALDQMAEKGEVAEAPKEEAKAEEPAAEEAPVATEEESPKEEATTEEPAATEAAPKEETPEADAAPEADGDTEKPDAPASDD
ncbi:MAG: 50S ribosomal protein L10 [Candidatus Peribacteraceae bacterium]|jgi:large subunit ribosomal protein L10|nr:50S ribosomal protein L10 [Candidatus Peribacteraceae bacterium]